eukprot:3097891-Rhodomonas_salina.3
MALQCCCCSRSRSSRSPVTSLPSRHSPNCSLNPLPPAVSKSRNHGSVTIRLLIAHPLAISPTPHRVQDRAPPPSPACDVTISAPCSDPTACPSPARS